MIWRITLVAMLFSGCVSNGVAQNSIAGERYSDHDAYQIYDLLLPQEEVYSFGKGTIVIREETEANQAVPEGCLFPDAVAQFKDAIADYNRLNHKRWLLQRSFEIERPYELVNSDTINSLLSGTAWEGFYQRYPDSGGFIVFSAVGFNQERTRALVYSGSSCGNLCGSWSFHLFQKANGHWKQVPGVSCHTAS